MREQMNSNKVSMATSLATKLTLFVLAIIIPIAITQDHTFDCSRSGALCSHDNATCNQGGMCSCPEDFAGYDCLFNETGEMSTECDNCQNEGICIEQDGEPTCYCEQSYYGKTCSLKRVSHHCKHDSMIVSINPNMGSGAFEGKIYVMGQEDDEDCEFIQDTEGEGFTQTLMYENCGGAATNEMENGDTERSFQVLVRYSDLMMVASDEKYTFRCVVRKTGTELQNEEFLMNEGDARFDLQSLDKGVVSEDYNPVSFAVQDPYGQPLSGPVNLGSMVTLLWQKEGDQFYEAFQLLQVRAKNGHAEDHPQYAELPLIKDGCVYPGAKPVLVSFEGDPSDHLKIVFKSFVLKHTLRLQISTLLKVCENKTECEQSECPGNSPNPNAKPSDKKENSDVETDEPATNEEPKRKRRDLDDTTPSFVTTRNDGSRSQYREYDTTIYVTSPQAANPVVTGYVAPTTGYVNTAYVNTGHLSTGHVGSGHVGTVQAGGQSGTGVVYAPNNPYVTTGPGGQYYGYRQVVYENPESAYYYYNNRPGRVDSENVAFYSDGNQQACWPSYCMKGLILLILTVTFGFLFLISLCCCVYYCVKSHDRPPKNYT